MLKIKALGMLAAVAILAAPTFASAQATEGWPHIQARTVICDTPEQTKAMLAKAEAGGRDALDPAVAAIGIAAVNTEAGRQACELANYVFIRGPDSEVVGEWALLPVIVLGYVQGGGLAAIKPVRGWTATKRPGDPA